MMKKSELHGNKLRQKHIKELIKQDKLIELVRFQLYGFNHASKPSLGGMYNDI